MCPANLSTGGPEELHQLAAQLISIGKSVSMHYYQYESDNNKTPVHNDYKKYNIPYSFKIKNSKNNIVIFPETYTYKLWDSKFSNTQKVVWWLSVTFYLKTLENIQARIEKKKFYFIKKIFKDYPIPTIHRLRHPEINHIAHSFFSIDFLKENKINPIGKIAGYMDEMFQEDHNWLEQKENIIIYNAKKNGDYLERIIKKSTHLTWVALQNMTLDEIVIWMKKAKIYIDFGFHPGREKMPREAVLLNCCLISGKQGSAKFKEDLPIKDEYHFDETDENIDLIIRKLEQCLVDYQIKIKDFEEYKVEVLNDRLIFEKSVNEIFNS
jgi:hypothetical protein